MRKFGLLVLLAAFFVSSSYSQTPTVVTGTIKDTNGVPYSFAKVSAQLIPTTASPTIIVNGIPAQIGGQQNANADVNGVFSMNLFCNSAGGGCSVISPSGTQWQISVNVNGAPPPLGTGPQACSATLTITGASQSVSSSFSACPALSNLGGAGVSLTPSATQTIIPTVNGAIPLQVQQPGAAGATTQTDFAVLGGGGIDTLFSVGTLNNGQNARAAKFSFGVGGLGGSNYSFYGAGPIQAGTGGAVPNFDFPVFQSQQTTTPTTPVASTNIMGSAVTLQAGVFEVTVYYVLTTAGVGGTAITFNLSWTDAQQAQTDSTLTSSGLVLGQFAYKTFIIQQQAAGNVTYTITETGAFSTHPILALKIAVKKVL